MAFSIGSFQAVLGIDTSVFSAGIENAIANSEKLKKAWDNLPHMVVANVAIDDADAQRRLEEFNRAAGQIVPIQLKIDTQPMVELERLLNQLHATASILEVNLDPGQRAAQTIKSISADIATIADSAERALAALQAIGRIGPINFGNAHQPGQSQNRGAIDMPGMDHRGPPANASR